ncbi:hypothetical protein EVA_20924 [gut metagenome]|uniref:Uncharacterized protein n=1 Tax=gut metagenome TaxID=749906 RepID=J9F951_9ZZZZ
MTFGFLKKRSWGWVWQRLSALQLIRVGNDRFSPPKTPKQSWNFNLKFQCN